MTIKHTPSTSLFKHLPFSALPFSALTFSALLITLTGCIIKEPLDQDPGEVRAGAQGGAGQENSGQGGGASQGPERLDLLFVIDNSRLMISHQQNLIRSLTPLVDDLITRGVDYRIAVTTTDISTQEMIGNVMDGDQGSFEYKPERPNNDLAFFELEVNEACRAPRAPILSSEQMATRDDHRAGLLEELSCRLFLGTKGNTYEKGLEATRRALSCDGANRALFGACCEGGRFQQECDVEGAEQPQFLRPDATLAVIYLSNEDDCSTLMEAPGNEGCDPERCSLDYLIPRSCLYFPERLTPPDQFATWLRSLKRNPDEQVIMMPIVAPRLYNEAGIELSYSAEVSVSDLCEFTSLNLRMSEECCPEGRCPFGVMSAPSCVYEPMVVIADEELVVGYPGKRYLEFAEALSNAGSRALWCTQNATLFDPSMPSPPLDSRLCPSLCDDDLTPTIERFVELLRGL